MSAVSDAAGSVGVKIDTKAIGEMMRATDGPVMRRLLILGEKVKVRTIASLRDGFPRQFLAPRIVVRVARGVSGQPSVRVGNVAPIRTAPHPIVGNPVLVFAWPKMGGGVFVFRSVNHPGSNFYRYLQERLEAALIASRGDL